MKSLLPGIEAQQILPEKTRKIANELLDRYPDIFKKFQDTKTEALLRDVAGGTKTGTDKLAMLSEIQGLPYAAMPQKTINFEDAWTLRQGLGEKIGLARAAFQRKEIDETAYSQIKKLFGAISDDIDTWGRQIGKPEISETFKSANNAYKHYVVKYDILQRAYAKANDITPGTGSLFSPQKFSNALRSIVEKDRYGKVFKPEEITEFAGLANIMQTVNRAGQYLAQPQTGVSLTIPAVSTAFASLAAAMGGNVPMAVTVVGEIGAMGVAKFLTTTPTGKNLMYAASKVAPNSAAMGRILDKIYNLAPKIMATVGTDESEGNQ